MNDKISLGIHKFIDYSTNLDDVSSSKVTEFLRKQLCLSDDNLLKLCEIGIFLQEAYGSPRDIEWAILNVRTMHIFISINLN